MMLFCWLRLMLMMLAGSANDQWAADAHDALCWLRPIELTASCSTGAADGHDAREF